MLVQVPDKGTLVLLVGVPGSGKSTLVERLLACGELRRDEVISSDEFRQRFTGDVRRWDDETNKKVFTTIHRIANSRLKNGKLTVVDATNVRPEYRKTLSAIADRNGATKIAIVLRMPVKQCIRNNAKRKQPASEDFIREDAAWLEQSLTTLSKEGFDPIYVVSSFRELSELHLARQVSGPGLD